MEAESVTLLVVDDDEVDRETIIRSLRKVKVANPVETAVNGVDALERLRGTAQKEAIPKPVIVILDWKMPKMNGLEFLQELRADPELRETLVFVLTTSSDEEDVVAAYKHLVAGYVLKETAGRDFMRLIELLDLYWRVVEVPTHEPELDRRQSSTSEDAGSQTAI